MAILGNITDAKGARALEKAEKNGMENFGATRQDLNISGGGTGSSADHLCCI